MNENRLHTASSLAAIGRFEEAEAAMAASAPSAPPDAGELLLRARIAAQRDRLEQASALLAELDRLELDQRTRDELARLRSAVDAARARNRAARRVHPVLAAATVLGLIFVLAVGFWIGRSAALRRMETITTQRLLEQTEEFDRRIEAQSRQVEALATSLAALNRNIDAGAATQAERAEALQRNLATLSGEIGRLRNGLNSGQRERQAAIEELNTRLKDLDERLRRVPER